MSKTALLPNKSASTHESLVIEGVLTALHYSSSTKDLLGKISKRYPGKSGLTVDGQLPCGPYEQAAITALDSLYMDDESECFICLLDDKTVYGTFFGASKLPVGKKVKAVVEKRENVLLAEGVLCESEGLVWVKITSCRGIRRRLCSAALLQHCKPIRWGLLRWPKVGAFDRPTGT